MTLGMKCGFVLPGPDVLKMRAIPTAIPVLEWKSRASCSAWCRSRPAQTTVWMQRNEQDRAASEGGRLEESCEHAAVLGDVLEDVECANDVERARRRLERVHLDQLHAGQAISCMGEMLRRHVGAGQFQAGKRLPHCRR